MDDKKISEAFELSYCNEALPARAADKKRKYAAYAIKRFQAIFCTETCEGSLRTQVEAIAPDSETLVAPGFFGVEFYMQRQNAEAYEKLCPTTVTPKHLVKEYAVKDPGKHDVQYIPETQSFWGGLMNKVTFGLLGSAGIQPDAAPSCFEFMNRHGQLTIEHKNNIDAENGLQIGFTVEEMAARVENLLKSIGLINDYAPLIYVVGHGSSTSGPQGISDCGACSGHPGSVNARVFCFMANHPGVRLLLSERGIHIPDETQFVGGLHDTAANRIEFYDEGILSLINAGCHKANARLFEKALGLNAKERTGRP